MITTNIPIEDIENRVGLICKKTYQGDNYVCTVQNTSEALEYIDQNILDDVQDWVKVKDEIVKARQSGSNTIEIKEAE